MGYRGFCATTDAKTGRCVKTRPVETWSPILTPDQKTMIHDGRERRLVMQKSSSPPIPFLILQTSRAAPALQGDLARPCSRNGTPALRHLLRLALPLWNEGGLANAGGVEGSRTARDRWLTRLDYDRRPLGVEYEVIVHASNGAYPSDWTRGRTGSPTGSAGSCRRTGWSVAAKGWGQLRGEDCR